MAIAHNLGGLALLLHALGGVRDLHTVAAHEVVRPYVPDGVEGAHTRLVILPFRGACRVPDRLSLRNH